MNNPIKNICLLCFKGSPLEKRSVHNAGSDRSALVEPLVFHDALDQYIMVFLVMDGNKRWYVTKVDNSNNLNSNTNERRTFIHWSS